MNESTAVTASLQATYSPEDNKLRLYSGRVDEALYARLREAGFIRAYKQGCFVAPTWTPEREDLLLELCADIEDENTSLMDRAEARADRFETYSEHRRADAQRARAAVSVIAEHIPLGQPILVGHHSEPHARRDAERIENGLRKAVNLWETAQYWIRRAEGARCHAEYKERPDVRYRRIAELEADLRRMTARYTPDAKTAPQVWDGVTHVWCGRGRGGHWVKESHLERIRDWAHRWETHYRNRIAYERAMLEDSGGIAADQFQIEKGGRVRVRDEWLVVLKVNKTDGRIVSVTTNSPYVRVKGIEEIEDCRSPTPQEIALTVKATQRPPLVNCRLEASLDMTYAQWQRCERAQSGYAKRIAQTPEYGAHRQRITYRGGRMTPVFLSDRKVIERPPVGAAPVVLPREKVEPTRIAAPVKAKEPDSFDDLRSQLREGVHVVSAPQLFPTPRELARRMVAIAGGASLAGRRILEPCAGTGVLIDAVREGVSGTEGVHTVAVEIDQRLCTLLDAKRQADLNYEVLCADFLTCGDELGQFDVILMNPPFAQRQDISHVSHALTFLKPGGRLVAVMSHGFTFRGDRATTDLRRLIEERGGTIESLPPNTFIESGTGVMSVLVTLDA